MTSHHCDLLAHKAENTAYVALSRKSVLTSDLDQDAEHFYHLCQALVSPLLSINPRPEKTTNWTSVIDMSFKCDHFTGQRTKHREVKLLGMSHTARRQQSRDGTQVAWLPSSCFYPG